MNLKIEKFRSIELVEVELFKDEKITVLFGLSGTGKSTIVNAIQNSQEESYFFDKHDMKITMDEVVISEWLEDKKIIQFNENEAIEIAKNDTFNSYDIISFGSDKLVYDNLFEKLESMNHNILEKLEELKIKDLNNNHEFINKVRASKNGRILYEKRITEIEDINMKTGYKYSEYLEKKEDYIKWHNTGYTNFYSNPSNCPFCFSKRKGKVIIGINTELDQCAMTASSLKNYHDGARLISKTNYTIEEMNDIKSFKVKLDSDIKEINKNELNISKLKSNFKNMILTGNSQELVLEDVTIYSRELKNLINEYNEALLFISKKLTFEIAEMDKVINENETRINKLLKEMHIFYEFSFDNNHHNSQSKYSIKPNDSKVILNNINPLSYGEKNIIALLLKIFTAQRDDILILDDPLSSFDDFKRNVIATTILELKKERNCRILLLTHDEYFLKQITLDGGRNKEFDCLLMYRPTMNNRRLETKSIGKDDFTNVIDLIMENFEESDLYLKLTKIRRISELKRVYNPKYKKLFSNATDLVKLNRKNGHNESSIKGYLLKGIEDPDEEIENLLINTCFEINYEEYFTEYSELSRFEFINDAICIDKLISMRFLGESKKFSFKDERSGYKINDLVHLVTSPYILLNYNEINFLSIDVSQNINEIMQLRVENEG